jgi:predicted dithiol-disulfide oxidoreductase (DUF899 family)
VICATTSSKIGTGLRETTSICPLVDFLFENSAASQTCLFALIFPVNTRAHTSTLKMPMFPALPYSLAATERFYSGEMSGEMADPGQDPRGAPDLDPLWQMFDYTPAGRGTDWYPKLTYENK